jgi:mono/diheme cytochrome c family protein
VLVFQRSTSPAFWCRALAALTFSWLTVAPALAQTTPAPNTSRGALLYSTHCIACHDSQIHWRDMKLATDWPSLKAQVRRWQASALLGWKEDDIIEVTRHLNALYYRFPERRAAVDPSEVLAQRAAPEAKR